MLCELSELTGNAVSDFVVAWGVLTLLGGLSMAILSGGVFYCSYARPTFEQWQWKLNPEFPEPAKVRLEIKQMLKSLLAATLCPAAALLLSQKKFSGVAHAYCSVAPKGEVPWGLSAQAYLAVQFVIFWVGSDFYEWAYHQVGHRVSWCWNIHRHHHVCAWEPARPHNNTLPHHHSHPRPHHHHHCHHFPARSPASLQP